MKKELSIGRVDINSPVILGLTALSLLVLVLNLITGGWMNRVLAVHYSAWADPMMYVRLFTHVVAHADFPHYLGNFLLILVVGPGVEEKYGGKKLLLMFAVTALVTGLVNVVFFRGVSLVGASGLVFMLILLSSFTNLREGKLPLTVILVAVFYIGNEVVTGLTTRDSISQLSHILGGVCGAGFGFGLNRKKLGKP